MSQPAVQVLAVSWHTSSSFSDLHSYVDPVHEEDELWLMAIPVIFCVEHYKYENCVY
jgi:hypothetical protein